MALSHHLSDQLCSYCSSAPSLNSWPYSVILQVIGAEAAGASLDLLSLLVIWDPMEYFGFKLTFVIITIIEA